VQENPNVGVHKALPKAPLSPCIERVEEEESVAGVDAAACDIIPKWQPRRVDEKDYGARQPQDSENLPINLPPNKKVQATKGDQCAQRSSAANNKRAPLRRQR
jgi:hypothetical protein